MGVEGGTSHVVGCQEATPLLPIPKRSFHGNLGWTDGRSSILFDPATLFISSESPGNGNAELKVVLFFLLPLLIYSPQGC